MGWLEVLALLKRIAPLLGRLAPMLEALLATRAGSRADSDAALARIADDMRGQLAATGEKHDSLADTLAAQAAQIAALSDSVGQLRKMEGRNAEAFLDLQTSVAALRKLLRMVLAILIVLLLACAGLLAVLVLRRPA